MGGTKIGNNAGLEILEAFEGARLNKNQTIIPLSPRGNNVYDAAHNAAAGVYPNFNQNTSFNLDEGTGYMYLIQDKGKSRKIYYLRREIKKISK